MGILVVSKVFGGFSYHPNLLASMMGCLSKNRGHGVAVLYTEILRRPSLIMMVIYLGKKKKDVKNADYLIRIGLAVIQSCMSGTRKKVSRDSRTRNGVELARHRFEFSS